MDNYGKNVFVEPNPFASDVSNANGIAGVIAAPNSTKSTLHAPSPTAGESARVLGQPKMARKNNYSGASAPTQGGENEKVSD